jgi:5-methylcytosine-specific restriction endonuclease McrA
MNSDTTLDYNTSTSASEIPEADFFDTTLIEPKDLRLSVWECVNRQKRKLINISPEWQRNSVWTTKQKRLFIESILSGAMSIPPMYLYEYAPGKYMVIDGAQRCNTVFEFYDGKFELKELPLLRKLNGFSYAKLADAPNNLQDRFDSRQLNFIVYPIGTPAWVIVEEFKRLNTGGTKLNAMEIWNGIFDGPVMRLIRDLAKEKNFRALVGGIGTKRMTDYLLVLKALAFLGNSPQSIAEKNNTIKSEEKLTHLKAILTAFCEKNKNLSEEEANLLKSNFNECISRSLTIFGKSAFRLKTSVHHAIFQAIVPSFLGYDKKVLIDSAKKIKAAYEELCKDREWTDSLIKDGIFQLKKARIRWDEELKKATDGVPGLDPSRNFPREWASELFGAGLNSPICGECGNEILSLIDTDLDHIKPHCEGGKTIKENMRPLHRTCNRSRKLAPEILLEGSNLD